MFGAIESTNVVGYQGLQSNASRQTMIAPTFLGIGDATGCKLSDLKVVGYDAAEFVEEEWTKGCSLGDFILQFLNADGTIAAKYYWVDDGETGPAWCTKNGTEIDATEVSIPAGKGMWVKGTGKTLVIPAPEGL